MFDFQPALDRQPVVVGVCRTPIGRAFGVFENVLAHDLIVPLIARLMRTIPIEPGMIDEVILGNAVGGGGNVARLAALSANLPASVPGLTVDRQCGSGLEAINLASRMVQSGAGECYLAGGVESVSTAPWRVEKPVATGRHPRFFERARFSTEEIGDPDMGVAAENVARECAISRERQDLFALRSHQRAVNSIDNGLFAEEIVPIKTKGKEVDVDECPRRNTSLLALSSLVPRFIEEHGTVTAGNACPLNDGGALALIVSRRLARDLKINKGMGFVDAVAAGVDPNLLGLGPVKSTRRLLERQPKLKLSNVSTIEFNEAFAAQVLGSLDQLGIDSDTVNREGGAIAIGHPFGASGAILTTRLFYQLARANTSGSLAMAMLGIAGGLGLTTLFEWINDV